MDQFGAPDIAASETASADYARRLQNKQQVWWKKLLRVQAPYQWNLRRQLLGRTLEIGCGIGRNLQTLGNNSVGIDHNPTAVGIARESGHTALTVEEWETSPLRKTGAFDGLLMAHVLEHMGEADAQTLLETYLLYIRPGGRVFLICPQEKGYSSDPTHLRFIDGTALVRLAERAGLTAQPWFSFPFPRSAGKFFIYNEFCLLATKPL